MENWIKVAELVTLKELDEETIKDVKSEYDKLLKGYIPEYKYDLEERKKQKYRGNSYISTTLEYVITLYTKEKYKAQVQEILNRDVIEKQSNINKNLQEKEEIKQPIAITIIENLIFILVLAFLIGMLIWGISNNADKSAITADIIFIILAILYKLYFRIKKRRKNEQ